MMSRKSIKYFPHFIQNHFGALAVAKLPDKVAQLFALSQRIRLIITISLSHQWNKWPVIQHWKKKCLENCCYLEARIEANVKRCLI